MLNYGKPETTADFCFSLFSVILSTKSFCPVNGFFLSYENNAVEKNIQTAIMR